MNKIDKWLLDLAVWNKKLKDINTLIGEQIALSIDSQPENASALTSHMSDGKSYWLYTAYAREYDGYRDSYFSYHEDDVEGYLQENCQHAYKAHMLIQERKEIKRELGKAKRKVTAYANRLMNSVAS